MPVYRLFLALFAIEEAWPDFEQNSMLEQRVAGSMEGGGVLVLLRVWWPVRYRSRTCAWRSKPTLVECQGVLLNIQGK